MYSVLWLKKYQQLNGINSRFVAKEGQFNDTDSDFILFQAFNRDFFEKLQLSKKKEIVMPGSIALGRSALPLRFAEWLQKEINSRLGVNYSIVKTETVGYDGYGLKFNPEISIESQLPSPQQVNGIPGNVVLPVEYEVRAGIEVTTSKFSDSNVERKTFMYFGAVYDFELTDGVVTTGTYTQPGKETKPLSKPLKTYLEIINSNEYKKLDTTEVVF